MLLSQRTLHRNDGMVIVVASEAKQSPAQAERWLLSHRALHCYCRCERSEAVSTSSIEIASVATSAPSFLSLRAKRNSLHLKHGDCFCRKERSIAMTVWLLSLRAKRSSLPPKQRDCFCRDERSIAMTVWLLSLRAKRSSLPPKHGDCFCRKERSIVIVTANKNNAGLPQTMPFSSADVKPSAPPAHGRREYFLPGIPRFPFIFPLFSKN